MRRYDVKEAQAPSVSEASLGARHPSGNAYEGLQAWLDGLVTTFSDRIHPIDIHVAVRADSCPIARSAPPAIASTTRFLLRRRKIHGHSLLTKREPVFGAWTQVKVVPP